MGCYRHLPSQAAWGLLINASCCTVGSGALWFAKPGEATGKCTCHPRGLVPHMQGKKGLQSSAGGRCCSLHVEFIPASMRLQESLILY